MLGVRVIAAVDPERPAMTERLAEGYELMAAYGLYTHIQSNKRRSVALLIGLFLLVYVLVYAGALVAEALSVPNAPLDYLMRAARLRLRQGGAVRHRRRGRLDRHRLQIPPGDDRRHHRRAARHPHRGAAAL